MEPLAYTIHEATRVASVGRTLLFERIASGELPVIRIGRRVLIPADGLRDWLDAHRSPAPALRVRKARRAHDGR